MTFDELMSRMSNASERRISKSALHPVLGLAGIVSPAALFALSVAPAAAVPWLIGVAIAPVATAIFGFLFLLFVDRPRLHTEEHIRAMKLLSLIGTSDGDVLVQSNESGLPLISNPKAEGGSK